MTQRQPWNSGELLLAFRLYCRTPFGKLHQHNPDIIELAGHLGRTPSAIAMKACNFASLDPVQQARGINALGNVSHGDRELWNRFESNPEAVAADAEAAAAQLFPDGSEVDEGLPELVAPSGPSEIQRIVRARRVQSFFRSAVLTSYGERCAITDLRVPALLNASHIIPWSADETRRADPRNGICLNVLFDRAFDRGLVTFDEDLRLVIAPLLRKVESPSEFHRKALLAMEGTPLRLPERFAPDPKALAHHRDLIFNQTAA